MRCVLFASIAISLPSMAVAQSTKLRVGDSIKTIRWDEMVGKPVTIEGLAWGAFAKGLGQHLILPNGRVYVRGFSSSNAMPMVAF